MADTAYRGNIKKKGFTLVELLVVIAIVAALSAVCIVGYVNFIGEAEKSADEQTAAQMNVLLSANEILKTPSHIADVQNLLKDEAVADFEAKSKDSIFYWISSINRIVMWETAKDETEKGKVVFPLDAAEQFASVTEPPVGWYLLDKEYTVIELSDSAGEAELTQSITNADADATIIVLPNDKDLNVTVSEINNALKAQAADENGNKNITLDLNGSTLEIGAFTVPANTLIEITNGKLNSNITVDKNASLVLRNIDMSAGSRDAVLAFSDSEFVLMEHTDVKSEGFALCTITQRTVNTLKISISNSSIEGSTAVLASVPIGVDISNSTVIGHNQAIVLRGATAVLKNNEIYNCFGPKEDAAQCWNLFFPDNGAAGMQAWGSRDYVPVAAITLGNDADSQMFKFPTSCVMTNNTIHVIKGYMAIYIEGMSEENSATLDISGSKYFYHDDDTYQNGVRYGSDSPVMYDKDMDVTGAALIYSSDEDSYVTVNGQSCRAPRP